MITIANRYFSYDIYIRNSDRTDIIIIIIIELIFSRHLPNSPYHLKAHGFNFLTGNLSFLYNQLVMILRVDQVSQKFKNEDSKDSKTYNLKIYRIIKT